MRLFVAMDIPDEVRAGVAALAERLRPVCRRARWVRVAGMHLTLKFIGEVSKEQLEPIRAALQPVRSPSAVEVRFRGVGFFPDARRPRVFWAGIEAAPNLAELAAEIEQRLEPLGIAREQRAFKPHLTLARFDSPDGVPSLREALATMSPFEFGVMVCGEFHLYRSELERGGAVYTRLATVRFAEGAR